MARMSKRTITERGHLILRALEVRGWNQAELARRLGYGSEQYRVYRLLRARTIAVDADHLIERSTPIRYQPQPSQAARSPLPDGLSQLGI